MTAAGATAVGPQRLLLLAKLVLPSLTSMLALADITKHHSDMLAGPLGFALHSHGKDEVF